MFILNDFSVCQCNAIVSLCLFVFVSVVIFSIFFLSSFASSSSFSSSFYKKKLNHQIPFIVPISTEQKIKRTKQNKSFFFIIINLSIHLFLSLHKLQVTTMGKLYFMSCNKVLRSFKNWHKENKYATITN